MPRIVTAHVELEDGSDFISEIANLTPHSLFVRTTRRLPFRTKVTVTFFSVSIQGEAAFVSRAPEGIVVAFEPTAAMLPLILARIPEIEALDPEAEPAPTPLSIALPPRTRSVTGPRLDAERTIPEPAEDLARTERLPGGPGPGARGELRSAVAARAVAEEGSIPTDVFAVPDLELKALVEESTMPALAPMGVAAAPRARADTVAEMVREEVDIELELEIEEDGEEVAEAADDGAATVLDLPAQKLVPKTRGRPAPVKRPSAAKRRPPPARLPPKRG